MLFLSIVLQGLPGNLTVCACLLLTSSQVVQFLGERYLLPDEVGDYIQRLCMAKVVQSWRLLRVADASLQVSQLVGVHARGGHFDRTSPVEVIVAEVECKLLKLALGQIRLVQGHKVVRRAHAALGALD